jgi:hypothetical protein
MRRVLFVVSAMGTAAIVLFAGMSASAQSLGDVARENREKKAQDGSTTPSKVITNKDLQKDPDGAEEDSDESQPEQAGPELSAEQRAAARRSTQHRLAERRASEQRKRQILEQKNRIAALQARIDQINADIQSAGGSVQYEPPYNVYQARQLRRASEIQRQLDAQKIKLSELQEAARRAGMHSAVYDP